MLQAFKHGITLSNILKHRTIISNSSLFSYSLIYIREIFFLFITDFIKHPQTSYNCFKLVPFFVFFDLYFSYSRDFFFFLQQILSNILKHHTIASNSSLFSYSLIYSPYSRKFFLFTRNKLYQTSSNIVQLLQIHFLLQHPRSISYV